MEASDTRSDAITKIEGDKNCNRIAVYSSFIQKLQ